jgi:hypothetical protein
MYINSPHFYATFFLSTDEALFFTKNGLATFGAIFFKNSSGHPAGKRKVFCSVIENGLVNLRVFYVQPNESPPLHVYVCSLFEESKTKSLSLMY